MPIFGARKFNTKKPPARKAPISSSETSPNGLSRKLVVQADNLATIKGPNRKVDLNLGIPGTEINFNNGEWIAENGKQMDSSTVSIQKSHAKLRKQVEQLQEENYMWRLKYEVLLNMLTQATAESHLQQREIEKLKHTV